MATQTTNLNLVKPSYDDNADIAVINNNMDMIDNYSVSIDRQIGNVNTEIINLKGRVSQIENTMNLGYVKIIVSALSNSNKVIQDSRIKSTMVCPRIDLNPTAAQTEDWEIITSNGQLEVSGNIDGEAEAIFWLAEEAQA